VAGAGLAQRLGVLCCDYGDYGLVCIGTRQDERCTLNSRFCSNVCTYLYIS